MEKPQADVINLNFFKMKKTLQKFDLLVSLWFSTWDKGEVNLLKIKELLSKEQQKEFLQLFAKFKDSGRELVTFLRARRDEILKSK